MTNKQNILSIPNVLLEVIIEFLNYDSIFNFYEYLGKYISKKFIIPFLSRKYKILDNNKYFSKNKIVDQLWTAACNGRKEIVSMLLEVEGIDVNRSNTDGKTPLWTAIYKGHKEIVSILLKVEGIDVNQAEEYGETPLWIAVNKGHKEIVSMLLKVEGIDVNQADNDGVTPLWIAAHFMREEIVSILLKVEGIDKQVRQHVESIHKDNVSKHRYIIFKLLSLLESGTIEKF